MEEIKRVQVVKCLTCGKIFSMCIEPNCYNDVSHLREIARYVNTGNAEVSVIDYNPDDIDFGVNKCCGKKAK